MKTIKYDPHLGIHIANACEEAVQMAIQKGETVKFNFNGIEN